MCAPRVGVSFCGCVSALDRNVHRRTRSLKAPRLCSTTTSRRLLPVRSSFSLSFFSGCTYTLPTFPPLSPRFKPSWCFPSATRKDHRIARELIVQRGCASACVCLFVCGWVGVANTAFPCYDCAVLIPSLFLLFSVNATPHRHASGASRSCDCALRGSVVRARSRPPHILSSVPVFSSSVLPISPEERLHLLGSYCGRYLSCVGCVVAQS